MAKKTKANETDIAIASKGDKIPCPHCKRMGWLGARYRGYPEIQDEHGLLIVHEYKWMDILSPATGFKVPCNVVYDGCLGGKKVGKKHEVIEEDF